jgi:broad specificity phosphatase PhoE
MWRTVQSHPSAAAFPDGESMAEMSARSVAAVRRWDARVEAEHGADAIWVAVSHGDVIKAILADALAIHLDAFQRIVVDPASLSVVRYTPLRPFVVTMNTSGGDLSHLKPQQRKRRRRTVSSDAAVGGGAGATA